MIFSSINASERYVNEVSRCIFIFFWVFAVRQNFNCPGPLTYLEIGQEPTAISMTC